jgi:hypothetical protein
MRVTFSLDDDAVAAVRCCAENRRLSVGKAASLLIRRGAQCGLPTRKVSGLPVLDACDDFPLISSARVRELLGNR